MLQFITSLAIDNLNFTPLPKAHSNSLELLLNIVFSIAGSLALLFIVIGGLRYVTSQGDPNNTARAKNTIIYALVGLVITISAYAIVGFVVKRIV